MQIPRLVSNGPEVIINPIKTDLRSLPAVYSFVLNFVCSLRCVVLLLWDALSRFFA